MFPEMEMAFRQGEADAPSEEVEFLRKRAVSANSAFAIGGTQWNGNQLWRYGEETNICPSWELKHVSPILKPVS